MKIIETVNSTDLDTEEALCDLRQAIEDGRTVHVKIMSDLDMKNIRKKWDDQANPSEICMPRIKLDLDPEMMKDLEEDIEEKISQGDIAKSLFETNMKKYRGKTLTEIGDKKDDLIDEINRISMIERENKKLKEKIEELKKENKRLKFQVENNDNECNSIIYNFEDVIRSIGDKKEKLEKENIALKNMINHMKNDTE